MTSPAAAQGDPVGGTGNHYSLAGAGNFTGKAGVDFVYGDPGDEVYFGDFVDAAGRFGGDGRDDAMVRRGNAFIIRGQGGRAFHYGDPGDVVLVGDWDGDGTDTLTVRRGNRYFVKNDIDTGVADYEFTYGDPGDVVLVGNWDGQQESEYVPSQGSNRMYRDTVDTLMVRRGNHFFVHNDNSTDVADHDFTFGNPDDVVLVGDWAQQSWSTGEITTSSDGADQIVVRRGNTYIESQDFRWTPSGIPVFAGRSYMYWDVTDTAFTARLEWLDVPKGGYNTYTGDGLAVRR